MNWKKEPYWLKGGFSAVIIGLLLSLVGASLVGLKMVFSNCPYEGVCDLGIFATIGNLIFTLPTWPFRVFNTSIILESAIYVAQFFITGALIGLIIGKIKSGKE